MRKKRGMSNPQMKEVVLKAIFDQGFEVGKRAALKVVQDYMAAYPTDTFIPPTGSKYRRIHELMKAVGGRLDAFSDDIGRRVAGDIAEKIEQLKPPVEGEDDDGE